jgi:hypothetical protein
MIMNFRNKTCKMNLTRMIQYVKKMNIGLERVNWCGNVLMK